MVPGGRGCLPGAVVDDQFRESSIQMLDNLVTNGLDFGPRSWLAVFIWVIGLVCGYYFYRMWQERNPVRMSFLQRFGLGLLSLSALGLVLMLVRGLDLPVLGWPLWGYLAMLATLLFLGGAAWYYTQKLPALTTTSGRQVSRGAPATRAGARSSGNGARTYNAPAAPVHSEPRPVATTTRREARRDRKRKSR